MGHSPYYIRNSEEVVREYANTCLAEDRGYADDDERIIEINGELLTAEMVDRAITDHFED